MKHPPDFFYRLSRWHRYASLYIEGNLPGEMKWFGYTDDFNLYMNAPISFQDWLTYPYETREEQEKHLWA